MKSTKNKIKIKYEPITLSEFLQLHDRVEMFKTSYDEPLTNVMRGTVIGFHNNVSYTEYGQAYHGRTPGEYTSLGAPLIRFDYGDAAYVSCSNLSFVHVDLKERRDSMYAKAEAWEHRSLVSDLFQVRIGNLQETPVVRGCKVRLTRLAMCKNTDADDTFNGDLYVRGIQYDKLGSTCSDRLTPYPAYSLSPYPDGGVQRSFAETDFVCITHGNFWHYYLGDKSNITFASLDEEASFHKQTGRCIQMRNPATDNYAWTLDEVLAALDAGTVDALTVSAGLFGAAPMTLAYKFIDTDVGNRVRHTTIAGFKTP